MSVIVGVDEVGRGCWAGPLVAGAVVLARPIPGLRDSKKLSKPQRKRLAEIIHKEALAIGLGWVSPRAIDGGGITAAVKTAMSMAVQQIQTAYDQIVIDGNFNFLGENPLAGTLVGADDSVPAVSAASIIAKVARDDYMAQIESDYPQYHFAKHVGYGTKLHAEMLKLHGPCVIHRMSFKPIKALVSQV